MTKHLITPRADENVLTSPKLYLSSAEAGWEGLVAEAFHEPKDLEGWIAETIEDTSLILFSGGAMRMEQRIRDGSWRGQHFRQGDMILRPGGGTSQEVRWKGLSYEPTRTLHLHLSKDLLSRTAEEVANDTLKRLALIGNAGFQDPLLMQIGFALWQELEESTPGGKLYAQTAAQMLAVHLLRHYTDLRKTIKEPMQGLTGQQMKRVEDFVEAHLGEDLSLEMLAQQSGFSAYYFARMFRRTTGESPHQFVLRKRIKRAQELLKKREMPLTVIAIESGFANQSHFTQVFKRYLGVTPYTYRQNYAI